MARVELAMTVEELARLVERMREAQRRYFDIRTQRHLQEAKTLEREVDEATGAILRPKPKQGTLL